MLLKLLDLDGYRSLVEKYSDSEENRKSERAERYYALRNYKYVLAMAQRNGDKEWTRLLQYAYSRLTMIQLYYIISAYLEGISSDTVWADVLLESSL